MSSLRYFCVLLVSCLLPFSSFASDEVELDLAFVTKMPEMEPAKESVGGLSQLATFVKWKRETRDNFLFFHGGDSLAPSAMSSFDFGTHMIDLLNVVGPDVLAVNEREFAYKEDQLVLRTTEAAFPFVSSNIHDPYSGGNLEGVEDHQCFDIENYKICAFSILDPITHETYLPDRLVIEDSFDFIAEKANALRGDGADLVVLLISHGEDEVRKLIESGVLDVVLYSTADEDQIYPINQGLLVKQGTDEGNVVDLRIALQGRAEAFKVRYTGNVVPLHSYKRSPTIDKKVEYYKNRLDEIMGAAVGKTGTHLDTRKEIVRTQETAFGNMLADALREYYGAELALANSGGIRGNRTYQPGEELTRKNIHSEMPFRNNSIFIKVKGRDLIEAMENSVSLYEDVKGRFPIVSGFTLHFCPANKVGERVVSVLVNGAPIEPERTYTLSTLGYLFNGGDGFTALGKGEKIQGAVVANLWREITSAYIEKKQTVSPKIEGRIVNVCQNPGTSH